MKQEFDKLKREPTLRCVRPVARSYNSTDYRAIFLAYPNIHLETHVGFIPYFSSLILTNTILFNIKYGSNI